MSGKPANPNDFNQEHCFTLQDNLTARDFSGVVETVRTTLLGGLGAGQLTLTERQQVLTPAEPCLKPCAYRQLYLADQPDVCAAGDAPASQCCRS